MPKEGGVEKIEEKDTFKGKKGREGRVLVPGTGLAVAHMWVAYGQ